MAWITAREARDSCRHIEAAKEHLRLAAHYVQDDIQVLAMVANHGNNLEILGKEMAKVAEDAREREDPPKTKNIPGTGYLPCS